MVKIIFTHNYSYRCIKNGKIDSWDIYRAENKLLTPFATGISEDCLQDVVEKYEEGKWCDFCRCDGIITADDGSCITCNKCDN